LHGEASNNIPKAKNRKGKRERIRASVREWEKGFDTLAWRDKEEQKLKRTILGLKSPQSNAQKAIPPGRSVEGALRVKGDERNLFPKVKKIRSRAAKDTLKGSQDESGNLRVKGPNTGG